MLLIAAAPHFLLDRPWFLVRVVSSAVDSASVVLVYLLGRRLYGGRAGLAAAAVYLLHPLSVLVNATTMSEQYMLFFMLGGGITS